jgi:hypothetical protein
MRERAGEGAGLSRSRNSVVIIPLIGAAMRLNAKEIGPGLKAVPKEAKGSDYKRSAMVAAGYLKAADAIPAMLEIAVQPAVPRKGTETPDGYVSLSEDRLRRCKRRRPIRRPSEF